MQRVRVGHLALLVVALSVSQSYADFEIREDDVPFVLGARGQFIKNAGAFEWAGFDSFQTVWDFTDTIWPGGAVSSANLLAPGAAPSPAPDSFPGAEIVELDSMPGQPPTYLFETNASLYYHAEGIAFETGGFYFIGNYQPDYRIYIYPMYLDCSWSTSWYWRYEYDPPFYLQVNETHDKYCISYGKVKVPASGEHYWPCLVIRDHYIYSDNFGGSDDRWIYEWVVPGRFSGGNGVVAVMGLSGGGANFRIVDHLFRLEQVTAPGWDMRCPDFFNTTIWPDTDFAGPYPVATTITDSTGVGADSLFYQIDGSAFTGVGHDSVAGDEFYFTIPQVSQSCTIGYFLWAADSFSVLNSVDIWNTDPLAAPEEEVYSFAVTVPGVNEGQSGIWHPASGICLLQNHPNPFSRATTFTYSLPPRHGDTETRRGGEVSTYPFESRWSLRTEGQLINLSVYDVTGRLVRTLVAGKHDPGVHSVTWDGRDVFGREVRSGVYLLRLRTGRFASTRIVVRVR